ncbi:MAG: hypothetical protein GHCLOJNM_02670 [bacterium]|nr:hypothetical protein [bacterium]
MTSASLIPDTPSGDGIQDRLPAWLFIASLALVGGLTLAVGALAHWGALAGVEWLAILPALPLGVALFVGTCRWPSLIVHLSLVGVVLDQWEGLKFTGVPFLTATKILLLVAVLILILRGVIPGRKNPPLLLPAAALAHLPFSLICLGSALAFAYSWRSGLRWVIAPVTLPFLAIVLTQFLSDPRTAARLVRAFALYSFIPVAAAGIESVIQRRFSGAALEILIYGVDDIFRVAGSFDNPNDFVVLLLFSVPILLLWAHQTPKWSARILLLSGAALQGMILVKTYSRSGYVSMAFTLLAVALLGRGRIRRFGLLLCLVGALGMLALPDTRNRLITLAGIRTESAGVSQALASLNYRKQLLQVAWWEFIDHPILGIGFSNVGPRAKSYSTMLAHKSTAENTYLEILAELGMVGITAYLFFLGVAWTAMRRGLERCRGDSEIGPIFVALAAGYCGFAFNSLFDTNLPDNLPWVLLAVMVHLKPLAGNRT